MTLTLKEFQIIYIFYRPFEHVRTCRPKIIKKCLHSLCMVPYLPSRGHFVVEKYSRDLVETSSSNPMFLKSYVVKLISFQIHPLIFGIRNPCNVKVFKFRANNNEFLTRPLQSGSSHRQGQGNLTSKWPRLGKAGTIEAVEYWVGKTYYASSNLSLYFFTHFNLWLP